VSLNPRRFARLLVYNLSERHNSSRKFPNKMYGVGPEGIGAVRARTHEEQRGGQLLQSWNPSIIFVLIE
jgi:hypothetical protein